MIRRAGGAAAAAATTKRTTTRTFVVSSASSSTTTTTRQPQRQRLKRCDSKSCASASPSSRFGRATRPFGSTTMSSTSSTGSCTPAAAGGNNRDVDSNDDSDNDVSSLLLLRSRRTDVTSQGELEGQLRPDRDQFRAARLLDRVRRALLTSSSSNDAATANSLYYDNAHVISYNKKIMLLRRQQQQRAENKNHLKRPGKGDDESVTLGGDDVDDDFTPPPPPLVPKGAYLWGDVGIGKTMLMGMFYESLQLLLMSTKSSSPSKYRRCHYHAFMSDVHERIHRLKRHDLRTKGRNFAVDTSLDANPVVRVAQQLSEETSVLCLDEFQVTDIADAMLLKQLFETMFENGTALVTTSNRPPDDLYEGGLNRGYFLPFIDLLKRHCVVHPIRSSTDYRRLVSEGGTDNFYFVSDDDDAEVMNRKMDDIVHKLRNPDLQQQQQRQQQQQQQPNETVAAGPVRLPVGGDSGTRYLLVPSADAEGRVADFTFDSLCRRQEVGPSDYRVLARCFGVVAVRNVPILTLKHHNEARRFITCIDELYEARVPLLCSAAAQPEDLFVTVERHRLNAAGDDDIAEDTLAVDEAVQHGYAVGASASIQELSFAFKRAASRLREMTSRKWWDDNYYYSYRDVD